MIQPLKHRVGALALAGLAVISLSACTNAEGDAKAKAKVEASIEEARKASHAEGYALGVTSGEETARTEAITSAQARFDSLDAEVKRRETAVAAREKAVAAREAKVTGAEKTAATSVITEGIWTVGLDIAAGTYRTVETVGGSCYWSIYRSGSNGEDIIQNDIVTGGRPTVTVKKGQDFKTARCGDWKKVA